MQEQRTMRHEARAFATETFEPISLTELVDEAELLTRRDRKYLLPVTKVDELLRGLDPRTRVLEIDGARTFTYDSVYFDTSDHLAYRLTMQGHRHRFKLRTRTYVDTQTSYLEVKTKDGRRNTVKQRIEYSPTDRTRITQSGLAFAAERLEPHGHRHIVGKLLPVMSNRYSRTTLLLPCGSRATLDSGLFWSSVNGRSVNSRDFAIVESKAVDRASSLDRLVWRSGYRPTGISKFGVGTALLHPELPHNKWTRVLNGPLAALKN